MGISPALPPPPPTLTDSIDAIGRSYTVVWCDSSIGSSESSLDDSNTIIRLTRIINKKRQMIHTFKEMQLCEDFLKQVNHVCLIVSGSLGEKLVPRVHNLEQLHSIYIFCLKPKYHKQWSQHYSKVRLVTAQIDQICNDLKMYFMPRLLMEYDQLQFDIFARSYVLPKNNFDELSFVYSLSTKILLSQLNSTKEELIEYCSREFTNDYQIRSIKDLEQNYARHDVIWWFTKDKFFQEIINQALGTHDLYTLCAMNFLVNNLERRLATLQPRTDVYQQPLMLYFSQTVSAERLEKIQKTQGGLMCIHEFLFANVEQATAPLALEVPTATSVQTKEINILFRIQIPPRIEPNVPFANIGAVCRFVHQKEYLFGRSSVFRLNHIEAIKDVPRAWFVHLTLVDKNDPQLLAIHGGINVDFLHEGFDLPAVSSTIKTKLSLFKVTRKFFERISHFNLQQIRTLLLHYHFGMIHSAFRDFDRSIEELKAGIQLIRNESIVKRADDQHICLVPFYSSLGIVYQENNNSIDSFPTAFQALQVLDQNKSHPLCTVSLIAAVHYNLGWIYKQLGNDQQAKLHYNEVLKLQRSYLPDDHPGQLELQQILQMLDAQISPRS